MRALTFSLSSHLPVSDFDNVTLHDFFQIVNPQCSRNMERIGGPGRAGGKTGRKRPSSRDKGIKNEGEKPRLLSNKNKKVVNVTMFVLLHIGLLMLDVLTRPS